MKSQKETNINQKNLEELLKQKYLTAEELMIIIPNLKIKKARAYINLVQKEMESKKIFIPETRPKVALTNLIKKKFGL